EHLTVTASAAVGRDLGDVVAARAARQAPEGDDRERGEPGAGPRPPAGRRRRAPAAADQREPRETEQQPPAGVDGGGRRGWAEAAFAPGSVGASADDRLLDAGDVALLVTRFDLDLLGALVEEGRDLAGRDPLGPRAPHPVVHEPEANLGGVGAA